MVDYHKAGLLVFHENRLLMCRKNNTTSRLILPGGCIEEGESDIECLKRELREELGDVSAIDVEYVGTYDDEAATDDPAVKKTLRMELYMGTLIGEPKASSEIVELVWFGEDSDAGRLTPIFINRILPDLAARGMLPWPWPLTGDRRL